MNIHRANIDVQFITDQYAVAQYVSNYLTKLEGGSTALLKNINDEALREGEAGKVTLGKLVKALDRGREVAIQEAIFRLLGLTMTNFSEVVRFINSAHPHRRDGLLKQNLDDLPEGESVFHNSVHDYYRNRPHNSKQDNTDWDKMSLAEFVSNYNIFLKKPKSERTEIITLQNKTGYVVKRSKQCVIRYFLRYENDEEYHRALLVLFFPFRDEMAEIHSEDVTMLYEAHEEEIEFVRSQFEKHRKLTDLVADIEKNQHNELGEIEEDDEEQSLKLLETTNISDIDKYIEEAQATASRILDSTKPLQKMSDDEYHEKINSLNPEQRRIFDDLVERFMDVDNPDPFYLYIGGEAGTGKSYLLRLLMEAARRIPKMSGKELDKPHYLTMAPTGVAAYIIQGMTIESALGIMPSSNRSFKMGGQSKNSQFRFTYEDLKVIFIDEISMVDSNKLNIINLRLQEIRGNNLFMGGVSIICFGDFGQLPPVGNPEMIWGKCTTDSRSKAAPNLWDDNFKIFYLKMKMRSKDDKYSEICDQVRKGELTPEVIEYLKDRERPCPSEDNLQQYQEGKISIIVTTNADRKKINSEKLDSLIPDQPAVNVVSVDKATNVLNPPPIPLGQPLTRTGQLESEFTFKKGAPVMITANSQEPRHKMNGIVNGVRGFIDSFQYEEDGSLMVIWVRFNDDKTGQLLRIENNHLLQTHKPDDNLAVPIFRMKKTFKQNEGNTNWLRHQFPLTLCFAVTAHKVSPNVKIYTTIIK